MAAIPYAPPRNWIDYEPLQVNDALLAAKTAVLSLRSIPYQREWVEALQKVEFKREIAGTSRIEGAEFTDRELDAALRESPAQLHTRSQRQARAAAQTYRWIAQLPTDRPITGDLIKEIHARLVTGCDDDHCAPGRTRVDDENVTFGVPRHRGAVGGHECTANFERFTEALQGEYRAHDPFVQASAAHYHLAAMHPFLDGNGRTARALEALLLQRAGLRDTCFISLSNYYYDEKPGYLATLAAVRGQGTDLTAFLNFALAGIALQAERLLGEIRRSVAKALYRNMMFDLFNRLRTPRKRVIAERQIELLKVLLEVDEIEFNALWKRLGPSYASLGNPMKAFIRDITGLRILKAVATRRREQEVVIWARLEWPTEITETDFFQRLKRMPKAKTYTLLQEPTPMQEDDAT